MRATGAKRKKEITVIIEKREILSRESCRKWLQLNIYIYIYREREREREREGGGGERAKEHEVKRQKL